MLYEVITLPKHGVELVSAPERSLYANYKPSVAFGLEGKKVEKPKEAPVYRLDNLTLQGLYDDPLNPFIAVAEGSSVVMIGLNEDFKGYKLVRITSYNVCYTKLLRNFIMREKPLISAMSIIATTIH